MRRRADVCLLLEGTYPYVSGGVSSWVHQIIRGLPDLTFALVFVGGSRRDYAAPKYQLPANVVHLETHYLEDALRGHQPRRVRLDGARLESVRGFHGCLRRWSGTRFDAEVEAGLDALLSTISQPKAIGIDDFLFGSGAWEYMRERYLDTCPSEPFLDYFWTLRLMHGPIFQLAKIAESAPEARVYHTISTGYAGLLGAFLERRRGRALVLSEHGIYTKERKIDLNQAEWIDALRPRTQLGIEESGDATRALWIAYYEALGRLTYRSANPIIALYGGNRERQLADGADPARTRVVVNGVDVKRFESALAARPAKPPRVVGLVGRVVPIKDVKTFVRAMGFVCEALPDAEGWVVGGTDEEPAYAEECQALANNLGLGDRVRFLGHQDVSKMFPQLGVLMLSSISEAQPLAVLEAFASGVPCVTTDVGACREQIEGLTPADRALGRAGSVVPFADPAALGRAAVELLTQSARYAACQRTGLARVQKFYAHAAMIDAYRNIYQHAMGQ
ncbi:MAG: GT4 family glycosyltransferase PelF [Polyangiales bacterium]